MVSKSSSFFVCLGKKTETFESLCLASTDCRFVTACFFNNVNMWPNVFEFQTERSDGKLLLLLFPVSVFLCLSVALSLSLSHCMSVSLLSHSLYVRLSLSDTKTDSGHAIVYTRLENWKKWMQVTCKRRRKQTISTFCTASNYVIICDPATLWSYFLHPIGIQYIQTVDRVPNECAIHIIYYCKMFQI